MVFLHHIRSEHPPLELERPEPSLPELWLRKGPWASPSKPYSQLDFQISATFCERRWPFIVHSTPACSKSQMLPASRVRNPLRYELAFQTRGCADVMRGFFFFFFKWRFQDSLLSTQCLTHGDHWCQGPNSVCTAAQPYSQRPRDLQDQVCSPGHSPRTCGNGGSWEK